MRVLGWSLVWVVSSGCAATPTDGAPVDGAATTASARASADAVASSSERPPKPSAPPLASQTSPGCDVAVEALLESNVFRGSPQSQAVLDAHRASPDQGRLAAGIDHGAEYLSCTWRVRVNGDTYRYKRASHGGPASGTLRATVCAERAEAEETAAAIHRFTDACSDLQRGAYYGDILEPIEQP